MNVLNNIFFIIALVSVIIALANYGAGVYNRRLEKKLLAAVPVIRGSGKRKRLEKQSEIIQSKMLPTLKAEGFSLSPKAYNIILCIIVLIGVAIRVWKFGSVPAGFNQDGAMAAVDGKALADYATDRFGTWLPAHLYAWGYGQMSSLLSYMIAVFVKLFGLSPITARLPQLIMSLAGGVFFYLFVKDVFSKRAALIAAAFVAINPWHLVQSRWALDCNLLPHFFMGGLYFLNKGLSQRKRFVYISMIFFGLCMYCYGITIYTIPVFLLAVSIYYLAKKRLNIKEVLISALIYLLIAWPFLLTMAVNFFKWDTIELPFVTIQYFSDSVRSGDILLFSENIPEQLMQNVRSLLNTTFLQKKDLPWNDIQGFGTMFLCTMPFVVAGFVELFRNKTDAAKGLALFALLTGVWAGLLTNGVNVNRINIVYYGIMIFAVLGIDFVITEIKYTKWSNLAIYAVLGVMLVSTYFTSYAKEIGGYFYKGFGDALIAAENTGAQRIYVTADAQAKGYYGTSEILTLFYDKTDAKYFQGKTNIDHGKEWWAYDQRFIYVSMSPELVETSANDDAAYVTLASDTQYFDADKYDIRRFDNFCAVVKKK